MGKEEPLTRLVVASQNRGKRAEILAMLAPLHIEVMTAEQTDFIDVVEDGATFADNALKKAQAFAKRNRLPALADDSGLVVGALHGAPGVYSRRYAGEEATDADNNLKLLHELQYTENRSAKFHCALCLSFPDERPPLLASGEVKGVILAQPEGDGGFGYDPLFFCPDLGKSFGRSDPEEKAHVSHRGRALRRLLSLLSNLHNS